MADFIQRIHQSSFFGYFFHSLIYTLQKELSDCETVLDIGCGNSSPLQYCHNIKNSTGVEAFKPYLQRSQAKHIHNKYICSKIQDLDFPPNSFDAVILIEVIEHLSKQDALNILKKASFWARKKVIITTPNGFIPQKQLDNNPLQQHLSGWDIKTLSKLGFISHGLAGLKILRTEVENPSMGDDLTTSIKFRPKIFWFVIATLSQIFTYHLPNLAFELFNVKYICREDE